MSDLKTGQDKSDTKWTRLATCEVCQEKVFISYKRGRSRKYCDSCLLYFHQNPKQYDHWRSSHQMNDEMKAHIQRLKTMEEMPKILEPESLEVDEPNPEAVILEEPGIVSIVSDNTPAISISSAIKSSPVILFPFRASKANSSDLIILQEYKNCDGFIPVKLSELAQFNNCLEFKCLPP